MIDDGVKAQGYEDDQVKVADISIHLLDALNDPVVTPGGPHHRSAQPFRAGGGDGDPTDPDVIPHVQRERPVGGTDSEAHTSE